MAINLKGKTSAFYPNQDENYRHYIYLTSLQFEEGSKQDAQTAYSYAKEKIMEAKNYFSSETTLTKAYSSLESLVQRERQAEQIFLATNLGLNLEEVQTYGINQLMQSINKLLGFETSYKTNIKKIKEHSTDEHLLVDRVQALIYSFRPHLTRIVRKYLTSDKAQGFFAGQYEAEFTAECRQAIKQEILKVYSPTEIQKSKQKYDYSKDYTEFAQLMTQMVENDFFLDRILMNYGLSLKQMQEREKLLSKQNKIPTAGNLTLQRRGGNVYEEFISAILTSTTKAFNGQSFDTGSLNNMKADHIITIGLDNFTAQLEAYLKQTEFETRSVRLRNIESIEAIFEKFKKVKGSIVMVSDKNYQLNTASFANNKGFAAETPSLGVLDQVLTKAEVNKVEDLIFILANTGNDRINNEYEGILRFLATKIGMFLFDDVVITDSLDNNLSNINRIHVFNLNNIFVPLSVLLEAALAGLRSMQELDYKRYVNVTFHPATITYEEQTDGLEPSDWSGLYNEVLTNSKVGFHFFGDFINFIKEHIKV